MKRFLLIFSFLLFAFAMQAQTDRTGVTSNEPDIPVENVSGLWGVMSYMTGKIGQQLKTRLNVESEEKTTERTKVKIKVAGIVIERIENRPKQ